MNPDVLESQVNILKLTELESMLPVMPFTKVVHQIKILKYLPVFTDSHSPVKIDVINPFNMLLPLI